MRMCVFCMIACAMVFLIKGVQHGIVFSSTPCLKAGILSVSRPYPSSLPTPHSQPPQTLSSLASRLFTNTHKCVNTKPQPPSFPSFVNTPNKAPLNNSPLKRGQNAQQSSFCSLCLMWKFLR